MSTRTQVAATIPRLATLRWVIPAKLVDVFWGDGWGKHARYRLVPAVGTSVQTFFLFGHRIPQAVKSDFHQQVEQIYVRRNARPNRTESTETRT